MGGVWGGLRKRARLPAAHHLCSCAGWPGSRPPPLGRAAQPSHAAVLSTVLSPTPTLSPHPQLVFTFRSFQPGMLYTFRAQAYNALGWGPASAPASIVTSGGV